jgi:hypothetical protein
LTKKGWHTGGNQQISPAVLTAILLRTKAVVAVRCKIAYFPIEAVKLSQNKLKYAVF